MISPINPISKPASRSSCDCVFSSEYIGGLRLHELYSLEMMKILLKNHRDYRETYNGEKSWREAMAEEAVLLAQALFTAQQKKGA